MLAPRQLPETHRKWNIEQGAPHGHPFPGPWRLERMLPKRLVTRYKGPFSLQPNNTIRAFEYPWAYHAIPVRPGLDVLEIGGGLSGLQFALDRAGARVVNVDPGMAASGMGWPCDTETTRILNRLFGTRVELRNMAISEAGLRPRSFDVAVSISVLEHLTDQELHDVMIRTFDALRPGGLFVITLDLFPEVEPFTRRKECRYGRNINVRDLIAIAPFALEQGDRSVLCGFDEFDPQRILSRLSEYLMGEFYPALAQCLILRKPLDAPERTVRRDCLS